MLTVKVETDYQTALASDPKKKGVQLYKVWGFAGGESWIWARSKEQALAAVAKSLGYSVCPHRVGSQIEMPLDFDPGAWEGLR